METGEMPREEPFLAQMSLKRGKRYINVRFFPTPDPNDPRPFISKDPEGKEFQLKPKEQTFAKSLIFKKR